MAEAVSLTFPAPPAFRVGCRAGKPSDDRITLDTFPGTDQRIDASPDMAAGQQPPRATLVSPDQTTEGFVYELARHGLTVSGQSGGILTVLIFGVGTDYALLVVARYREELVRHEDRHGAMAAALRRVGPTILASGGTVTLSLLCLLTASINSDKGLGQVCVIGVVVVVFAMLTAPPMLLLIVGRGVFWSFVPHCDATVEANHAVAQKRLWVWLGGLITGRARPIWIITALLLGVMALVTLAEIGFIMAFGVLLDAFVVRSVLVPALVMDVGPAWWWLSAPWKQGALSHGDGRAGARGGRGLNGLRRPGARCAAPAPRSRPAGRAAPAPRGRPGPSSTGGRRARCCGPAPVRAGRSRAPGPTRRPPNRHRFRFPPR